MIGCLPWVLEVPRVVDDTEVPRILWVKCATSEGCKTIRIAVSTVKDSWVTALGLRPLGYKPCVCLDKWEELLVSSPRTWHGWVGLEPTPFMLIFVTSPYGYLNSYGAWFTSYWTCHSTQKLAFCKNLPISCIVVSWTKTWVACEYIQSTHWLATGYFIGQAWKNRI